MSQSYLERQKASGFQVGERVIISNNAESYSNGWENSWADAMDVTVGRAGKIVDMDSVCGINIRLDSGGSWRYPYFVLEPEIPRKLIPISISALMTMTFEKI